MDAATRVSVGIFNMIGFINFTLSATYYGMHRKALSIRDILSIIEFIQNNTKESELLSKPLQLQDAFSHAVELVIVDGLCLGIDASE